MRGCLGLEILAGLYQDEWAFIQHDCRWAFAWNVHRLGFGSDGRLYGCDAFWVRVDPFQTAVLRHGLHIGHRQAVGLNARHTGTCGGSLGGFFTRGLLHRRVALMTLNAFATRRTGLAWLAHFLRGCGFVQSFILRCPMCLIGVLNRTFFTGCAVATFAAVTAIAVA